MVDLGLTEKNFHTRWYLTGRKNQLLQELAKSIGDVEIYKVARELKTVIQELNQLPKQPNENQEVSLHEERHG